MRKILEVYWPLIASIAALSALLTALLFISFRGNEGHFIYALDDAYIHMAIAKNLSQSGIWGVTRHSFSSASSSLLWTSLLSVVYSLFGISELSSLVLNVICAMLLLGFIFLMARNHKLPSTVTFLLLISVTVLSPLPTLILEGMEHVLQIFIDLAFLYFSVNALMKEPDASSRDRIAALLLSPLVAMVRYEGVFLLIVVSMLFLARRRPRDAILVGTAGLLPIAVFGCLSVLSGWYFLPNSVLLKAQWLGGLPNVSTATQFLATVTRAERAMLNTPHLFALVILSLTLLILHLRQHEFWSRPAIWNTAFVSATLLHLQFAGTGWFFRYESYLVAIGIVVLAITTPKSLWPEKASAPTVHSRASLRLATLLLAALLAWPLLFRGASALKDTPLATTNIYQQQYQMGQFVREFYSGSAVAANDIGAIAFLADVRLLDLAGLSSLPVAEAMRAGRYDARVIALLAQKQEVKVAILYENWFAKSGIPEEWRKVGQWTIPNRVAAAHDTITFYAVRPHEEDYLMANLRGFSQRLPKEVTQRGEYTRLTPERMSLNRP